MADQFFYKVDQNGSEQGPVDGKSLKQLAASGTLQPGSLLRRESGDWIEASAVKGLVFGEPISTPKATPSAPSLPGEVPPKAAPDIPAGLASLGSRGKTPVATGPVLATAPGSAGEKTSQAASGDEAPAALDVPPADEINPFAAEPTPRQMNQRRKPRGLAALFSFDTLIGPAVVQILYFIAIIIILISWFGSAAMLVLGSLVSGEILGMLMGGAMALGMLLLASLYIVMIRVTTEVVMSIFKIREDIEQIRDQMDGAE